MDVIITHEWFKKTQHCPLCRWLPKGINVWFYHCIWYIISYIKLVVLTARRSSYLVSPLICVSHPWHSLTFHQDLQWVNTYTPTGISLYFNEKSMQTYGFSYAAHISRQMLELVVVWPRLLPAAFSYASL